MRRFLRVLFSRYTISALIILLYLAALAYFIFYFSIYSLVFFLCAAAVDIIVLIQLINRDINPEVKLTWLAVLLAVPLFGCALYVIFSSRSLHRNEARLMKSVFDTLAADGDEEAIGNSLLRALAEEDSAAAGYALALLKDDALAELYRTEGARYYPSGEEFFEALTSELRRAKRYVFIETFIISEGKMWDEIHGILKEKVREGVEVRILYDDIGSMSGVGAHFDKELLREGIECMRFGRITPRLVATHNNRDHRKITVIDGRIAFTGGINVADEYINAKKRFGHWKDGGISVEGDAVRGFVRLFLSLWHYTKKDVPVSSKYLLPLKEEERGQGGFVIPYGSGPSPIYPAPVCKNMLMGIINASQSYVFITTPYLIIDYDLTEALRGAAARGVDVRIITPGIPDKRMINVMTKSAYPRLIESGVRIFEYSPGFIHEKSIVADGRIAAVGTVNLDYRSLIHHYECGVWLAGCPVISDIRDGFLKTIEESCEVTPAAARLSFGKKIAKNLVRIFAPLM